jgi:hypothetical protein
MRLTRRDGQSIGGRKRSDGWPLENNRTSSRRPGHSGLLKCLVDAHHRWQAGEPCPIGVPNSFRSRDPGALAECGVDFLNETCGRVAAGQGGSGSHTCSRSGPRLHRFYNLNLTAKWQIGWDSFPSTFPPHSAQLSSLARFSPGSCRKPILDDQNGPSSVAPWRLARVRKALSPETRRWHLFGAKIRQWPGQQISKE